MTRTVLITGASGFVGRQVLVALLQQPVNLRLVARTSSKLEIGDSSHIESIRVSDDIFFERDAWWDEICRDVDIVIHLAWYAEPGKYLQSPRNLDCMRGSLTLATAAVRAGVKRFIGIGSCLEYDLVSGYVSRDTPLKPTTPYAAAKAALFIALEQYFRAMNVGFVWARLFYLYGEGEDERRLVAYLKSRLAQGLPATLTSGEQIRDYMDVIVAGQIIADVALGEQLGAINVCSGTGVSVRTLAEMIADDYGRRDLLDFGARASYDHDFPVVVGIDPIT